MMGSYSYVHTMMGSYRHVTPFINHKLGTISSLCTYSYGMDRTKHHIILYGTLSSST